MKTTSTFNLALFLLVILSTFACKGHKSGENNQTTDTVMVAKDYTQFVLKHLDVDKKKVMAYVTCSEQTIDSLLAIADTAYSKTGYNSLEALGLNNENLTSGLEDYKDTISTTTWITSSWVSPYRRYMTLSGMSSVTGTSRW